MNKLILLDERGTYQEVPREEYVPLEYGSPSFEYMRRALHCTTIEHLMVVHEGKPAHMFFDEEGLLTAKLPNARASAIAGNRHLRGPRLEKLRYNDLTQEPPDPLATMLATGMLIVGPAYIWTGEME